MRGPATQRVLRAGALFAAAVLVALLSLACRSPDVPASEAGDTSSVVGSAERDVLMHRADSLADRLIAQVDSVLTSIDPLSNAESAQLRRFVHAEHLARARRLGIQPVPDRTAAGRLIGLAVENADVVLLRTNGSYVVDPRMGYAVPLAVAPAAHMLERIGREFQQDLKDFGAPPYRFIVTNVLRTAVDQAHLRGTNVNAVAGESTHEYGTTADLYYGRFHYVPERDTVIQRIAGEAALDEAHLRERLRRAYREFGLTHAERIKAVLGRTLLRLQDEGLLLSIYERRQPVFHLTVARDVEARPSSATALTESAGGSVRDVTMHRFYANFESHLADVDADLEDLSELVDGEPARRSRLAQVDRARTELWEDLDRIPHLSEAEFVRSRPSLRRRLAEVEGELVRTRVEFADSQAGVRHRLGLVTQDAERTLDQLEAQLEHSPADLNSRYLQTVAELRSRLGELERIREQLNESTMTEFETVRSSAAEAASHLVAELYMLAAEVDDSTN